MTDLELLLDRFVSACLDVFGRERVEGIILHGSAHKGGGIPGYSDIDFMVFLTRECFDAQGELLDELVFAIQERIGPLPWQGAGFLDGQAYFYDARRLPPWWAGPVPGSYRVLHGRLPDEAVPTAERLRAASFRFLREELPQQVARDLASFADAADASLPRRLRLLGTRVTPAIFALAGHDADDVLELWAQPKFEALARLEARYPDDEGPALARRFYDNIARLYGEQFDADLGRETFRLGIAFLRWATQTALSHRPA
jgi:predicted nucleotidyltransferase